MTENATPVGRVQLVDDFDCKRSWLVDSYDDVRDALAARQLSRRPPVVDEYIRRFRRLVGNAFTPRRVERLRPAVHRITDELLDRMEREAEVDLVEAFALPLPLVVVCDLFGLPEKDRPQLQEWFAPEAVQSSRERRSEESEEGARYFAELVARRRSTVRADLTEDEQPDLVDALLAARDEQGGMTDEEVVQTLSLLLIAGHENVVNLMASGMLALFRHPDQLRLLRERPELIPAAVEELLRYTSPLQRSAFRYVGEEVEIGGVAIPATDRVSVRIATANRDPERFERPDQLDILRAENGHLAFGHGIHFCLGAPLARLEGQIVFDSLLRRFPDIALACAPEELEWRPFNGFIQGLVALPVRLRGAAGPAPQSRGTGTHSTRS